jgi:HK97 family phage prohead protease
MLLEHDSALEFGCTKTNLILHSDEYGIAFRCHLRNDEISRHVRALAESKAYSEVSIGFSYRACDTVTRTVSKTEILFINKATLQESSFLKAGACEQTHAVLADMKNCNHLFEDCKTSRFVSDSKFEELRRTLEKLHS